MMSPDCVYDVDTMSPDRVHEDTMTPDHVCDVDTMSPDHVYTYTHFVTFCS